MTDRGKPQPPPETDAPSTGEQAKKVRAGRKASQGDPQPKDRRARPSPLDPWKKARERVVAKPQRQSGESESSPKRTAEEATGNRESNPPWKKARHEDRDRPERRRSDDRRTERPRRSEESSTSVRKPGQRRDDSAESSFRRRKTERPERPGQTSSRDQPREGRGPRRQSSDRDRPSRDQRPGDRPTAARDDRPRFGARARADGPRERPPGDRRGSGDREPRSRGPRPDDRRGPRDQRRDQRPGSRSRPPGNRGPDPARRQVYGETKGRREAEQAHDEAPKDAAQVRAGIRLSEVQEVDLQVEKLIYGGDGLARFEGIPIFIPRSAPGDRIRARITERKLGYGRAEIVEILEPGPGRREAPCPHYEQCGGCDLQHLDDTAQLRLKAETVVETLRRLGGIAPPPRFEVLAGDPFGYRLRTQLHLATTDRGLQAGYFSRRSHELVPVQACPVLVPQLEEQLPGLSELLEGASHSRVDLAAGDDGQWAVAPPHGSLPKGEITISSGDFNYTYDARCFFQGHQGLVEDLVSHALGDLEEPDGHAYDLFSGVGLFSLPLSRRYRQVTSIEGDRVAARFARRNAKSNRAPNVEVTAQSVESWIDKLPKDAARVLVDPPRVGLSEKVRRAIMARRPRKLTYVSCEPPTLARDLKEMSRVFRIDSLVLIDMFPQTGHMESVVQMSLPESKSSKA